MVTRCDFLAALAAVVPLAQLERFTRRAPAQRVIVIGGGLAGLWVGQIGFIDTLAAPEGRIHFAGEHTSPWTGWMQGALESARRVVREING